MQGSNQSKGRHGEDLALFHLKQHGLKLVSRNYRCRFGEIDIVMKDGDELVFVEVKYRQSESLFPTVELVDFTKQKKLLRSANHYLGRHRVPQETVSRFDVVGITGVQGEENFDWIQNAFTVP